MGAMNGGDDSDGDLSLFRRAMEDVEPLHHDRAAPWRPRRRPEPLRLPEEQEPGEAFGDTAEEAPEFLEFRRPGIQLRLFRDLQRGLIEPEASLDLHGMRVDDARRALGRFLDQSLKARRRCVRIIHGKGRRSGGQPVIKQRVNQWLPQRREVLAFCSAPRWDGGTGAAYVLLSRKREQG